MRQVGFQVKIGGQFRQPELRVEYLGGRCHQPEPRDECLGVVGGESRQLELRFAQTLKEYPLQWRKRQLHWDQGRWDQKTCLTRETRMRQERVDQ